MDKKLVDSLVGTTTRRISHRIDGDEGAHYLIPRKKDG